MMYIECNFEQRLKAGLNNDHILFLLVFLTLELIQLESQLEIAKIVCFSEIILVTVKFRFLTLSYTRASYKYNGPAFQIQMF